jgi:putative hydrolase of the HAD superfamily
LDGYLQRVIFYDKRPFTPEAFKQLMYAQSHPHSNMITLITELKNKYRLKVTAVSNEGRELTEYRVRQFNLAELIDTFIVSSFVHIRKPDSDIYNLALDVTQTQPQHAVYIDDRAMLVEVACGLGIHGIHHTDLNSTCQALARLGLTLEGRS